MSKIRFYQKPTCTTCRKVHKVLRQAGVDIEAIDYYVDRLTKRKLKELVQKMGVSAKDIVRTSEPVYRRLRLKEKSVSEDEMLALMARYPDLIQRPILERGNRAVLARPAEKAREIL